MKNYHFRIELSEQNSKLLKKKSFIIKLKNDIHPYDMFEYAIDYLQRNSGVHFKLSSFDEYFDFSIIRGTKKIKCWVEFEYCHCCGGEINIGGSYDEE